MGGNLEVLFQLASIASVRFEPRVSAWVMGGGLLRMRGESGDILENGRVVGLGGSSVVAQPDLGPFFVQ